MMLDVSLRISAALAVRFNLGKSYDSLAPFDMPAAREVVAVDVRLLCRRAKQLEPEIAAVMHHGVDNACDRDFCCNDLVAVSGAALIRPPACSLHLLGAMSARESGREREREKKKKAIRTSVNQPLIK